MVPRRVTPVVAIAAALTVAGCGSTTVRHVTKTVTATGTATATSPSTTATNSTSEGETTATTRTTHAGGGGAGGSRGAGGSGGVGRAAHGQVSALARRSPSVILGLAAAALRRSGGYSMHADLVQSRRRTIIDLQASSTHRFEATTLMGREDFELIALPTAAYLKGNAAFWRHETGANARAAALAGHWLRDPARGRRSVTGTLGTLAPGTLARCLVEDHGTLTVERRATRIGGRSAVVVRDAGNAPGATPSTIAVAATGAPYPLRYVASGRTRRGGRIDVCNDGKGDGATGSITLDRFGQTGTISAPSGAQNGPPA